MSNYARFCDSCKHDHGPLYVCPSYPQELKDKILAEEAQARANLQDPEWVKKQIAAGTSMEAVLIMRMFFGL